MDDLADENRTRLQGERGPWLLVGKCESWRIFVERLEDEIEIDCCHDTRDAASLLGSPTYQSTVFDWTLSGSGASAELCRLARDLAPDRPLLAATASAAVHDRVSALEAGVDDCVTYEVEFSELLARTRAIARRRRAQRSHAQYELLQRASAIARTYRLSGREQETLVLLAGGTHLKEIAAVIGCGYSTVRTHLRRCRKLECSGTREAIVRFFAFDIASAGSLNVHARKVRVPKLRTI